MVSQSSGLNQTVCGVRNNDYLTIDGETYKVQSITDTYLVRLLNSNGELEEWGEAKLQSTVAESDEVTVNFVRDYCVEQVSRNEFHTELMEFEIEEPEKAAFLTIPVQEDTTYYTVPDHNAGFAVGDDGELLALFNNTDVPKLGRRLIEHAITKGVTWLFSFDTKLTDIYRAHGFEETDRGGWDEDHAPDNWDYETYGRPDVVWMELNR